MFLFVHQSQNWNLFPSFYLLISYQLRWPICYCSVCYHCRGDILNIGLCPTVGWLWLRSLIGQFTEPEYVDSPAIPKLPAHIVLRRSHLALDSRWRRISHVEHAVHRPIAATPTSAFANRCYPPYWRTCRCILYARTCFLAELLWLPLKRKFKTRVQWRAQDCWRNWSVKCITCIV